MKDKNKSEISSSDLLPGTAPGGTGQAGAETDRLARYPDWRCRCGGSVERDMVFGDYYHCELCEDSMKAPESDEERGAGPGNSVNNLTT